MKLDNFSEVLVLKQEPGDFKSGALIKGIKKSRGDLVVLIDADVFVASNLVVEIAKKIKTFDAVCCDFIPMMEKGFWYNYYSIFKRNWSNNPNNLGSLIGGATISLKKVVINEIGLEKFFSERSTAGVDYYMGLILKKHKKKIGFVRDTHILVPRPNNLKDFTRDQKRWLNSFYSIHRDDFFVIMFTLLFNIAFCLFPPLIFLSSIKKLRKINIKVLSNLKYLFTLFLVELIINTMSISAFVKTMTGELKDLGHFKAEDRYLS